MKKTSITLFFLILLHLGMLAQLELTSGYASNRNEAHGFPIQAAYEFKISDKIYTKSQIGFKYLHHFNNFVGATINIQIYEFHQTISYECVKTKKYIFKPNIGINFRQYYWDGIMEAPYNTYPIRAWLIEFRDKHFIKLVSVDDQFSSRYIVANLGFSIQLQNQFRYKNNTWIQITPFIEPDYDKSQVTGGCYIGIIFKNLGSKSLSKKIVK